MSYVIKQQGLKGVDLPRSGLLDQSFSSGSQKPRLLKSSVL